MIYHSKGQPGADDYYDEDDFIDPLDNAYHQAPQQKKQMTLAEEKEALKRKIKDFDNKKKKPPKYKKEAKDILNDAKSKFLNCICDLIVKILISAHTGCPRRCHRKGQEKEGWQLLS